MLKTDTLKTKHEEREKRRGEMSASFFQLKDGKNVVRILPRGLQYFSKEGDDDFALRYAVHYNLFEEKGFGMVVCPAYTKQTCPICEMVGRISDKTKQTKLRAKERYMYNVFDPEDGIIKVLETGPKVYDDILKFVVSPEWGDLFGIKDGRMITIERIPADKSGTGWADYNVLPSPQVTDVTEVLPDGWDAEIDKLASKIPGVLDLEELKRLVECHEKGISPVKKEDEKRGAVDGERAEKLAALRQSVGMGGAKETAKATSAPASKPAVVQQPPAQAAAVGEKKAMPGCQFGPQPDPNFPPGTYPFCFALEYSPRQEKCKTCWAKPECRLEFLKV